MSVAIYEGFYLFDSNRYARDPNAASSTLQDQITSLGGEILVSRLWGEQKLAYQIKGHQKGTYWLIYFRMDTANLTELNRNCQLNESLMRWMFTRVDPRLIDALVAHAQGIVPHTAEEKEKEKEEKEKEREREREREKKAIAVGAGPDDADDR